MKSMYLKRGFCCPKRWQDGGCRLSPGPQHGFVPRGVAAGESMAPPPPPHLGRHPAPHVAPVRPPRRPPSGQRRPDSSRPAPPPPPVLAASPSRERPPPAPPAPAAAVTSAVSRHHAPHVLRDTRPVLVPAHTGVRGALPSVPSSEPFLGTMLPHLSASGDVARRSSPHSRPRLCNAFLLCAKRPSPPRAPSRAVCSAVHQAHAGPRTERGTAGDRKCGHNGSDPHSRRCKRIYTLKSYPWSRLSRFLENGILLRLDDTSFYRVS